MSDENVGGLPEPAAILYPDSGFRRDDHAKALWRTHGYDTGGEPFYSADQLHSHAAARVHAALSAHGQPEPNGKLVGWWNGISRHDDRDGTGPSVRWGEGAENTYHDIPLYDGYNPIHYVTPPAHGQTVVDEAMVERAMDAFASVRVDPNSDTLDHDLMRAALTAALTGADHE